MRAIQWLARHAARKGHTANTYVILQERCSWINAGAEGYNIKMDTNKKNIDWTDLAQEMDEWRSLVNSVNPSAWGHLNPSSYCDVGKAFLRGI